MNTNYNEYNDSQLPAIQLLQKMGWQYINADDALSQRDGLLSNVILEDILAERLATINNFEYKGETYQFSHSNIQSAINALKNVSEEGSIVNTNEKVYDLLTLGKSFEEVIQGDKKAFSLRYIDWKNWKNNVFHIAKNLS